MTRILKYLLCVLLAVSAMTATAQNQNATPTMNQNTFNGSNFDFPAVNGTGYTTYIRFTNGLDPISTHTIEAQVTGTPTTCTYSVEGSSNGVNWYDLSGTRSCTTSEMFHIPAKPVRFLHVHVLTFTGTGSIVFQHTGGR